MMKRSVGDTINWESHPCPLCTVETLPQDEKIQWLACESCRQWFHAACLKIEPSTVASFYCDACSSKGKGTTQLRDERPKRAKLGIDYTALDSGQHVNSLRHAYTSIIETRPFGENLSRTMHGAALTKEYLHEHGFMEPIIVHQVDGLDMSLPYDLTVDKVAQLVGEDKAIEVMDVPTQDEDRGWTLGKWATYYNEAEPTRVRNVISLEVTDTPLGDMIKRPRIVRDLDVVSSFWPHRLQISGKIPKVQAYCLMSLRNSYTDFHVDFAGTSVYYHILQGSKTFLFIPPSTANLNKYSEWCKSSNQSTRFLADECKDTFKVELRKGDTMFIPSGWIHAVHTPEKSLVIGGNFLHLYGMQKHLEIANIEELTKVPGKFRFPFFNKTLWFTAIGVLVQAEGPSKHQILGLYKLAEYLFKKSTDPGDKSNRKAQDEIPLDHMQNPPHLLLKVLFRHVVRHAAIHQVPLPDLAADHSMSATDIAACPVLLKTDLSLARYNQLCDANEVAHETHQDLVLDIWVEVAADPAASIKLHTKEQSNVSALPVDSDIPKKKPPRKPLTTPNIYAENNGYLPPLKTFGPSPVLVPNMRIPAGNNIAETHNRNPTTCFRCKTRKRKCDKLRPCDSCKEAGLADTCSDTGILVREASSSLQPQVENHNALAQASPISMASPTVYDIAQQAPVMVKKSSRTDTPGGTRCGRCAKDKRPCGRQRPICDRCQKKGLLPTDCVYRPSNKQNYKHATSSEVVKDEEPPQDMIQVDKSISGRSSPEQTSEGVSTQPHSVSASPAAHINNIVRSEPIRAFTEQGPPPVLEATTNGAGSSG